MNPILQVKGVRGAGRVGVSVNYAIDGQPGYVYFITRGPGSSKPDVLLPRARRAVGRRLRVKPSEVRILGILTFRGRDGEH